MRSALRVEWWKLRSSRVALTATILMGVLLPAMGLGFYSVATGDGAGALAVKAAALLVGEGWVGYLGLIDQIAAVAVFLGTGVVVAWAFGREHADRTFPSLFALPTSRETVAAAKFVVLVAWIVVLSVVVAIVALVFGLIGGIQPFATGTVLFELSRLVVISLSAGLLSLPMAYVASVGRGYLSAIAVMAVLIAISQIAVLFGTGGWFPFTVPGLMAVAGAPGIPEVSPLQMALVPIVGLVGVWLAVRWWQKAEVV